MSATFTLNKEIAEKACAELESQFACLGAACTISDQGKTIMLTLKKITTRYWEFKMAGNFVHYNQHKRNVQSVEDLKDFISIVIYDTPTALKLYRFHEMHKQISMINTRLENLENIIAYAPGSIEYEKARANFESRQN